MSYQSSVTLGNSYSSQVVLDDTATYRTQVSAGLPGNNTGGGGGGGSDANYIHTQSSSATTWTVNHNLGKKPTVNVLNSSGATLLGIITHVTVSQLTIVFVNAKSGVAICN